MSRRVPAILILAQYLLATVAGGLFHDHGAAPAACAPRESHSRCEPASRPHCCDGHDRELATRAGNAASLAADCHGPCPVCQFLSKKPIPAAQEAEPSVARLIDRSAPVRPILRPQPLLRTDLTRAPPAFA
jgi:hypothetical protein